MTRMMRVSRKPGLLSTLLIAGVLAGCAGSTPTTYDLSAPTSIRTLRPGRAQIVVSLPSAGQVVATNRVLVRGSGGTVSYLPNVQWADSVPTLVQSRLIETYENAGRIGRVGRPDDKITPDVNLAVDIREFEIISTGAPTARVTLAVRMVAAQTGRIVAARIFSASAPTGFDGSAATRSLDAALQEVLREVVIWTATKI